MVRWKARFPSAITESQLASDALMETVNADASDAG
jgi:hypothetical protein